MGKSGHGEYAASGRTIRSYYKQTSRHVTEGLVARVVKSTATLSSFERQEFTDEFTFPDGLRGIADVFQKDRNARQLARDHASVYYSLGKRGRWSLPELLKSDAREGCQQSGRLTVVERFVNHEKRGQQAPDCIAVTDSQAKVKARTPKKTYSRFQDLKENLEGPEVCYEFSYPYPSDSWPNSAEGNLRGYKFWYIRNRKKASCKDKGVRNKGERWGMYSDRDLKTITKKGFSDFPPASRKKKAKLEKVQVVEPKKFKKLREAEGKRYPAFELGTHINNLIGQETPHPTKPSRSKVTESPVKKFSKKPVIYVDAAPSVSESQETFSPNLPVAFKPEPTFTTDLNIISCDLKSTQLTEDWEEAYTEGASLPRKFAIDATPLLQSCHGDMNAQFCQLLFQEKSKVCNGTSYTVTSVSLVGSNLADPEFCHERIASDFSDTLQEKKKIQNLWSVRDVVNLGILTFIKHATVTDELHHCSKRSETPAALKVLSSMFGWQSTLLSSTCAKVELREGLEKIQTRPLVDGTHNDYVCLATTHCGICCQELYEEGTLSVVPCTALGECQHYFCNDCWEAYLKTQISKNATRILCPEYKCDSPVDSVTVMSVIPSWYNKYVCRRVDNAFEVNREWKRCPSDHCHQVVKATIPAGKGMKEAFPVACYCGSLWCFECRKQAHWPVTCEEARIFEEVTRVYWDTMQTNARERITSVFVRKCPKCHYPIEKHLGCRFMFCILCSTPFCWDCMTPWNVHGDTDNCKKQAKSDEFDFTVENKTNRFGYYFNMVKHNTVAKHMPLATRQKRDLQLLHTNVEFYQTLDPTTETNLHRGRSKHCKKLMEDARAAGSLEVLDSLLQFKFEAHFTLAGAAKLAAMSRRIEKQIRSTLHQLQFIVDRITDLQEEGLSTLVKETNLHRLQHFIKCGKNCMYSIGRSISSRT